MRCLMTFFNTLCITTWLSPIRSRVSNTHGVFRDFSNGLCHFHMGSLKVADNENFCILSEFSMAAISSHSSLLELISFESLKILFSIYFHNNYNFFALHYSVYPFPTFSALVVWFNDSRVHCILLNIR